MAGESKIEVRALGVVGLEIRKAEEGADDSVGTVRGYAAVTEEETVIRFFGDGFREKIARGAFKGPLERGDDTRALFNHDSNQLLGRASSGTLRMKEDDKGLRVDIDLPNTERGREIKELIERGDLDGMSFAFTVSEGGQKWERGEDGMFDLRTVTEIDELRDVSVVTEPAYPQTSVGMRSRMPEAVAEMRARGLGVEPPEAPSAPEEEPFAELERACDERAREIELRRRRLALEETLS